MKKILFGAVCVLALAVSCKNTDKKETDEMKAAEFNDPECYQFTGDRDTVSLKISAGKGSDSVMGTLVYNLFEKDRNTGDIRGTKKGDLIIADYSFMSEGTNSTRQVAFKKVGDDWVEGYGDTKDENGRVVFTNTDSLEFEPKLALKKTDCSKVN